MTTEADQARRDFRRYRQDAAHDPLAAERWRYWSIVARMRTMHEAGLSWDEMADLLDLDPTDKALWSVRQGDRRVAVAQEVLAEGVQDDSPRYLLSSPTIRQDRKGSLA
ncbi:hypothetical protein HMPREF2757_10380 [Brevibacterium sp. HMSC063G07]|nr:hypothetical protein HMPREF2757_10380 [Brevibacterium sp. HMSC063G07]OFS27880.1 hypothetical protein HMPREF3162_00115 [Brevibacterium sp. HMSC07C04]